MILQLNNPHLNWMPYPFLLKKNNKILLKVYKNKNKNKP